MEGIDLPLISDDEELDYDLLDAPDIPSGFKVQAATSVSSVKADAKIVDEATETPTEASIHQPARKRRTNETFDSDASDGEMACNVGEEDNEECGDDNGESGADKFFGRLAGRVKRLGDKRQRLVSPTLEDEEEVQDEEIREQFLGGFEQILDGKKDEQRRNVSFFVF
ncbi:unnamed protein product [Meloidogyne enterolobii]|uniref:Uncharacterized protein n=1 Tax=Meloidogyne enterolobii TaxID=390850 RepID=A0ACB0Z298_MELEN